MKEWFLIDVRYACFGLETTNRIVTKVAPIGYKDLIGKSSKEVAKWIKDRNGTAVKVD